MTVPPVIKKSQLHVVKIFVREDFLMPRSSRITIHLLFYNRINAPDRLDSRVLAIRLSRSFRGQITLDGVSLADKPLFLRSQDEKCCTMYGIELIT